MEWLNVRQLAELLGKSTKTIRRAFDAKSYGGKPLKISKRTTQKGQTEKIVLWETNNSQADEIVAVPTSTQAVAVQTGGYFLDGVDEAVPIHLQSEAKTVEILGGDYSSKIITPAKGEVESVSPHFEDESIKKSAASNFLEKPAEMPLAEWFEIVLLRKLNHIDNANSRKSLASLYRKHFKKTGEIHPAVLIFGKAAKLSGRKSTLEQSIVDRFIEMVKTSADKKHDYFHTYATRKVTVFHHELEREFDCEIEIAKLYSVAKKHKLKRFFEQRDDEQALTKMPSFFAAEPVGALVQMDGVEADYFAIRTPDGKFKKPTFIEFFDFGSRKLLAMYAYWSESNENSVDIFNRFLIENQFAHAVMKIRPDNAKGFLNLKRCIKEINNRYSKPNGFTFVDDYAKAGAPKEKAHLESSHRAFHRFEQHIINRFKEKVIEKVDAQAKVGNQMRAKTVTHLDITLEELNASGVVEEYMRLHNTKQHRFTEDGVQKRWIPDERWNAHLAAHECFRFTEEDCERNRIYGYTKQAATISKEGKITYQKRNYAVSDSALFSRVNSTKVKISAIGNGKLAIFQDNEEGVYLGEALVLRAPAKSQKVVDLIEEKRDRAVQGGVLKAIKDKFAAINLNEYSLERIERLIEQGLTADLTAQIIEADPKIKFGTKDLLRANKFFYKAGELLTAKQATVSSINVY